MISVSGCSVSLVRIWSAGCFLLFLARAVDVLTVLPEELIEFICDCAGVGSAVGLRYVLSKKLLKISFC